MACSTRGSWSALWLRLHFQSAAQVMCCTYEHMLAVTYQWIVKSPALGVLCVGFGSVSAAWGLQESRCVHGRCPDLHSSELACRGAPSTGLPDCKGSASIIAQNSTDLLMSDKNKCVTWAWWPFS